MNPLEFLGKLNDWGPVFFGLGFIAPLIAQSMEAANLGAPLGLSTLQFGLGVGVILGIVAKWRGRAGPGAISRRPCWAVASPSSSPSWSM